MLNRYSMASLLGCAALATCGCAPDPIATAPAAPSAFASIPVVAETAGSAQDDGNDVAFWIHPSEPAKSLVLVSAGTAGLEAFALDGTRAAQFTGGGLESAGTPVEAGPEIDHGDGHARKST